MTICPLSNAASPLQMSSIPDGWHHTPEDTLDKISAKSLTISGEVFLESIRLLNAH